MKIQCFRQTCAKRTDRHTDIVTPRAPDGAKKIPVFNSCNVLLHHKCPFNTWDIWFWLSQIVWGHSEDIYETKCYEAFHGCIRIRVIVSPGLVRRGQSRIRGMSAMIVWHEPPGERENKRKRRIIKWLIGIKTYWIKSLIKLEVDISFMHSLKMHCLSAVASGQWPNYWNI